MKLTLISTKEELETFFPLFLDFAKLVYEKEVTFNDVWEVAGNIIGQGIIIGAYNSDDVPVGIIMGIKTQFFFSKTPIVQEVLWWVDPNHRHTSAAFKLLQGFEYWAKNVVNAEKVVMANLVKYDIGSLYEKRGYKPLEVYWYKELH